MADLNANINVGIETTQALNQLKALQKQISQFHQSVAKSSSQAAVAQRDLQRNFLNSVNSIQGFSAELRTVRTTAESFTNSLEKNKFSMREYFRYAGGATKTFSKNFRAEFSTIEKTAIERVKTLQTQYIKMGRDASGAMQAIAIRPTTLDMKDLGTQTAIAAQKQVIFNQLVKQGSTNLLNFGKNTQWAGRQLMVGFTLPLATLGMTAGRVFFDMEKAAIKFKKVYGDLFTAPAETEKAMESIIELGEAYSAYGIAVSDSLTIAADAAAAGFQGVDLQNQTSAALKLSVLGQLDLQKALETTISLQNAFQLSSADLAGEIDFLNAVENQTVVSLDDITEAVPRVAPVIKQLGGDVRDLAFFLAAMKEGGINAAQGANALKSGLASLINPSEKSAEALSRMGINMRSIVEGNQGDIAGTVFAFAKSLDKLDPLRRAQAIEQLFGKFQFARISALFDNITREGTQAQRVLELAGATTQELADLSESELAVSAASSMNKFRKAVEQIKVALAPIGELFVEIATPFVEFGTKMLEAFNNLPDGIKKAVTGAITILGGIGPIALMTFGLINNGIANMIKFFATVRLGYLKITGQAKGVGDETQYMTQEQLEAAAAAASLDQAHAGLTQRFTAERAAVDALRVAYQNAAAAGATFALNYPGMMKPGAPTQAQGFAKGGIVEGPGTGRSDSIPAMLSNGEAVIPAEQAKKYAPLIQGMIAGNLPGFADGVFLGMPRSNKTITKNREVADEIYQDFLKSSYANTAPTEYGHQISKTTGHSFPIFGLGGVYSKPGGEKVFVKPVLDEVAAMAEIRATQIARQAHGLEAPEQKIVVMRDPLDPTRERKFLALESALDTKFIQNEPKALFNEEQYFRQLVASLVRVDKDLAAGNVFGNVVADVGPGGVFDRASGKRALKTDLPSMEDQALINLLGIRGGAKRAFAESTLALMSGLTPEQYHQRMIGEIQRVLPALKQTVAGFGLTNPTEVDAYDAMIKRLEIGLGVDWSKFHSVHSAVKIAVPKKPKEVAGYANGVVSVPGPKGKGDVVPAMLSPGEAVIPTAMAKKYAPLIQGMIAGNIPGYAKGTGGSANFGGEDVRIANKASARALQDYYNSLIQLGNTTESVDKMFAELLNNAEKNSDGLVVLTKAQAEQAAKANAEIKTSKASGLQMGHLQGVSKILASGERESGSFVRAMTPSQNKSLDQGGQDVASFIKEWNSVTDGLIDAVKLGGAELTDGVRAAAEEIDNDIRDIAVSMAEGGKVTDEILTKAANQALENAKKRGGDSAVAANALEKTKNMKVVLPATVESLANSEALKPLRDAGKVIGTETANELKEILLREKWITPQQTSGGRTDYLTTELGAAATSRGAGSRLFRTASDGSAVAVERFAKEEGSKTYLKIKEKMARLIQQVRDEIGIGLDNASGAKSPSVKIGQATENIVDGVEQTIVNSKDEVAKATEQMLSPVTNKGRGPRRASDNPAVMAALAGTTQAQVNSGPRRASAPAGSVQGGVFVPVQEQVKQIKENTLSLSKFTDRASQATFALSSVSGILTMFGGEMSAVTGIVMGISSAMFALIQVTSLLANTKLGEIAASRAKAVADGIGGGFGAAGSLLGTGGFLSKVANGFKFVLRFLGPIGIGLSVLAIAVPVVTKLYQDQKNKMEAFGKIVDITADQIKFLGQQAGESPITQTGFDTVTASAQEEVNTAAAKQKAEDEEFQNKFAQQIAATKAGAVASVENALDVLAFRLSSSGLSDQVVNETIAGIIRASKRTDITFDFNSVGISEENTNSLMNSFRAQAEKVGNVDWGGEVGQSLSAMIQSFALQLEGEEIGLEEYNSKLLELMNSISLIKSENVRGNVINAAVDDLISDEGVRKQIKSVEDLDKRFLLLQASGGATNLVIDDLVAQAGDAAVSTDAFAKAVNAATAAQRKANVVTEEATDIETTTTAAITNLKDETNAINDKIKAYEILREAGYSTEEALSLLNDEVLIGQLVTEGGATGVKDVVDDLLEARAKMDAITKSGGGGSGSNPIQDAIDGLKKQRQEVLNTSRAYGELRKSGLSAAKAFEFAQNPELLSAMNAGLKAGTKQWDEIIKRIQAAEKATRRWQNATVQGQTEQFMETYNKVQDLFSAEEALLQAAFEATTRADTRLVESLEEKISGFNRQIEDYSRDLDEITEKENDINEAYDEKVKALEQTKKINDDILRQQKSQLSIADALSQGDVAAAASAMQQARSENAAAALEAQGNQLQLGREAQIAGLRTPGGLSRAQIEETIKNIKKEISLIESGSLRLAQDRIKAAQDELTRNQEALRVGGLSKTQWEDKKFAIDAAKARAEIYDGELKKALKNVEKIVAGWQSLNTTIKTTHNIHTVHTSSNGNDGRGGNERTGLGNEDEVANLSDPKTRGDAKTAQQGLSFAQDDRKAAIAKLNEATNKKQKEAAQAAISDAQERIRMANRAAANSIASAAKPAVLNPGMSKPTAAQLNWARMTQKKAAGGKVGYYPMGGLIPYMANGGMFQSVNTDTVPAMLTPGEFVIRRSAVDKFGVQNLKNINNGTYGNALSRGFNQPVYPEISRAYPSAGSGAGVYPGSSASESSTQVDNSVYNYSLSVNVEGTNASPDQIANVVMRKLQDFGSQRVRRQVIR